MKPVACKWAYEARDARDTLGELLDKMGRDGWEAWHIEPRPDDWKRVYFKKRFE